MSNQLKTYMLLAAIIALFGVIGGVLGGRNGMLLALAFAGVMNFMAYWYSAEMVLRMYAAQEVGPHNAPDLYQMVLELAARAQLPLPRIYVINAEQPNAFATGRDPAHAAIALTTGIMRTLSYDELRGVVAHELSHIKHRDILISTLTATIAGAIAALANLAFWLGVRDEEGRRNWLAGLLISIFAPLAAAIIQMAISRSREYLADQGAAELTRDPLALARALTRIEQFARGVALSQAEENPATAHMMIINPLSGSEHDQLFATHPTTANRVQRLQAIAQQMGQHG